MVSYLSGRGFIFEWACSDKNMCFGTLPQFFVVGELHLNLVIFSHTQRDQKLKYSTNITSCKLVF